MSAHHRRLDIYGTDLHLAHDEKGWASLRRRFKDLEDHDELALASTFEKTEPGVQHLIIWFDLPRLPDGPERVSVVAHEAFHAAVSITQHHGIPVTADNDEAAAYLVGWIAAWIWENLP